MEDRIILIQEEPRGPSELLEVPVPASVTFKVTFPDNQQLRSLTTQSIIIQSIRLIVPTVLSFGPILGLACAAAAEILKCSLVLYCEGWEKGHYIPLNTLNDVQVPGLVSPNRYRASKFANWKNVDWSKSYILYSNGSGGSSGAAYEFMFDIEYIKLDASGDMIIGPS